MTERITKNLRIFGRVQGVYYRAWCVQKANDLNLTGWVRNRKDASVEILATGHEKDIERLIAECYKGPPTAKVEAVNVENGISENLKSFEQRPTE